MKIMKFNIREFISTPEDMEMWIKAIRKQGFHVKVKRIADLGGGAYRYQLKAPRRST